MARDAPTILGRTPYYVLTGGLAIIFLFPLSGACVASVSPQAATGQGSVTASATTRRSTTTVPACARFLFNSFFVAVLTVAITLAVSTLGGYAFARFRFPGRDAAVPADAGDPHGPVRDAAHPALRAAQRLGLQNSLIGLSLVLAMFQLPFATYMMRISFEAVPREIEESALMDGCGTFSVLWRILLPSVRPGLITVGLFAFLAAWNDFFAPLILLSDSAKQTLPLAVANLRQQTMGAIDYGATEAGVVVMAMPCLILFLLLQRHYVRGFMSGAVKG